jgi:hypothetical protein
MKQNMKDVILLMSDRIPNQVIQSYYMCQFNILVRGDQINSCKVLAVGSSTSPFR